MSFPNEVMHETYLPVTEDQLRRHIAPVTGGGNPDGHVARYRQSIERLREFERNSTRSGFSVVQARQIEKDEQFWIAAALLGVFYSSRRNTAMAELLTRAFGGPPPIPGPSSWHDLLEEQLDLYFEVNTPSPPLYKEWLADHLDERVLVPYVREAAAKARSLEGSTKVDAMLIASSGFAVAFEAKVLSDASTGVKFDVLRNQLIRNLDVMLDEHPKLAPPLKARQPDWTLFVLVTPRLFKNHPHSRLYGRLIEEYRSDPQALQRDLPHRKDTDFEGLSKRIGWLTFEDINEVVPGSCSWLVAR